MATLKRYVLILSMCLLALVTMTGCETLQDLGLLEPDPEDMLSFHYFSRKRILGRLQRELEYAPGKVIYIRSVNALDSASITGVVPKQHFPGSDDYGLILKLSKHGRFLLMQATGEYAGQLFVFLLDGEFRGFVRVPTFKDQEFLYIDGPFTKKEADRIAKNAPNNFKRYN